MAEYPTNWQNERRAVPRELAAEAAANPGGTVAEIDGSLISDPNGYVPREAIVGVYVVGPDGVPTGDYLRNPDHGPVQDDFEQLTSSDHWLDWVPGDPSTAVRAEAEAMLSAQAAGARVEWMKIIDEPVFLTSGVKDPNDPSLLTIRRAALAVPFALSVRKSTGHQEILTGALSWVAAGLDQPGRRHDRTWLDLGATRAEAAESLQVRIFEVDAS